MSDETQKELARDILRSVGLELPPEPLPTAEAEMVRLVAEAVEAVEVSGAVVGPVVTTPEPRRSYQSLSTGQKLELILDRQEHQEKVLRLLDSKIDRVGLNTVNLSKNNQAIAAMLQALVGAMTEPEQPESLIQTVRGGF